MNARAIALTGLALVAFAGNSLLCRASLARHEIDPAAFTVIRIASGALVLMLLARGSGQALWRRTTLVSAAALFLYAAPFSYAYVRLGAGVGALVLFGAVQATMLGAAVARGERLRPLAWLGWGIAMGGLAILTVPGATAPDIFGVALMAAAGFSWGVYSLRAAKETAPPLAVTAASFVGCLPIAAALAGAEAAAGRLHVTTQGAAFAVASGAITSGLGYAVWHAALRRITAPEAAIAQLLVPMIAAAAGIFLLGEAMTSRLALAGAFIVSGVLLALRTRR